MVHATPDLRDLPQSVRNSAYRSGIRAQPTHGKRTGNAQNDDPRPEVRSGAVHLRWVCGPTDYRWQPAVLFRLYAKILRGRQDRANALIEQGLTGG